MDELVPKIGEIGLSNKTDEISKEAERYGGLDCDWEIATKYPTDCPSFWETANENGK